jgi:hypothetical protein
VIVRYRSRDPSRCRPGVEERGKEPVPGAVLEVADDEAALPDVSQHDLLRQ